MPGDRKGETSTDPLAKPIDCVDRTGNRMLWPAARPSYLVLRLKVSVATTDCDEVVLEIWIVFSKIVPKTHQVPPLARAELGGAGAREGGDLKEVLTQGLPVGAVRPGGRMGGIGAPRTHESAILGCSAKCRRTLRAAIENNPSASEANAPFFYALSASLAVGATALA